jgi:hypothetical protein
MRRVIPAALGALIGLAPGAAAQQPRIYAGGALTLTTQTHSTTEPLGGTTWGGSALFGVEVSPRVAVEVEPSVGGTNSWEYSYRPTASASATVVASRRERFFSAQVRSRTRIVEPSSGRVLRARQDQ